MSGAAVVSYNLSKFLEGEKLLLQLSSRVGTYDEFPNLRITTLKNPDKYRFGKLALIPLSIRAILSEVRRFRPDVVVLEGASWVVYHLLLLCGIRRMTPQAKIIYHAHNVEYLLRSQRERHAVSALTRWAEARVVRNADVTTAVSEVDQKHFAHLYGVRPTVLPNGVDLERFTNPKPEILERLRLLHHLDRHTLLFTGFYAYGPNREAIDFLVNRVMPSIREHYPSATLALTGGGAPYSEPWIRNVGPIAYDEFAAFVAGCGIAIAPIFSGSGTRLKILEAMAAGIPVVATEKGAEGLPLCDRKDLLLAKNASEFIGSIRELFQHPTFAEALTRRARSTIGAFSWSKIVTEFERIIFEDEMRHQAAERVELKSAPWSDNCY